MARAVTLRFDAPAGGGACARRNPSRGLYAGTSEPGGAAPGKRGGSGPAPARWLLTVAGAALQAAIVRRLDLHNHRDFVVVHARDPGARQRIERAGDGDHRRQPSVVAVVEDLIE